MPARPSTIHNTRHDMNTSDPKPTPAEDKWSALQIATHCGEYISARDRTIALLGMALEEIRPGYARLGMTVREDMLNSHDTCHGGMIFTLADCAFAFCCNADNREAVAAAASIDFLRPAHRGDRLTAFAEERAQSGRIGICEVGVYNQHGDLLAQFRGRSHQTANKVVPDLPEVEAEVATISAQSIQAKEKDG